MAINIHTARDAFIRRFSEAPVIITRAPGRVNIIGEHTDYNHGFVLPMALEQGITLLASPRQDNLLNVYAENYGAEAQGSLSRLERQPDHAWMDYLLGVAAMLRARGLPVERGSDIYIASDLPIGSGVSSSAALEMAALCLFEALGDFRLDGPEAARLGQAVENDFLGLKSGIMDQFASRCCTAGHALFLDCRALEFEQIPMHLPGHTFVIADTTSPRKLTASKYNERVAECQQAVAALQKATGREGSHLRDFTLADLETAESRMEEVAFRRAHHVLTENERTREACSALRAGYVERLGKLLNESDESLRDDYEVTSPELDAMTRIGRNLPGCLGARMTGAGFGGCTIHLVATERLEDFASALLTDYHTATGLDGRILHSVAAEGAQILAA